MYLHGKAFSASILTATVWLRNNFHANDNDILVVTGRKKLKFEPLSKY